MRVFLVTAGIAAKVMTLLAFLPASSPTLWAQESSERKAIDQQYGSEIKVIDQMTDSLKAAIKQRTADLLQALDNHHFATVKLLEDRARASKGYQQKKTRTGQTVPTTSLSGKVFAITKGGDVKPALLARVYLFTINNPINEWMRSNILARDQYAATVEAILAKYPTLVSSSDRGLVPENCRALLGDVDKTIGNDQQIAPEVGPAYIAETDETGSFKIGLVKAGDYSVVVRGRAGSNDVLWVDKAAIAGTTQALKLHSVAEACQSN
jgi:hypothetical protein